MACIKHLYTNYTKKEHNVGAMLRDMALVIMRNKVVGLKQISTQARDWFIAHSFTVSTDNTNEDTC